MKKKDIYFGSYSGTRVYFGMKGSTEFLRAYPLKLEDRISRHIVDSAIEVHRNLGGPGLLESVYEEALV
jgi:hypothetical protein